MNIGPDMRAWALRHHVGEDALRDLAEMLGTGTQPAPGEGGSETRVQGQVRLAARGHDMRLHRNNVGCLKDDRGVPVRYGLANDSAALNARLKSSDLIGWRRVTISQSMVGTVIAQFVAIECKRSDWRYTGTEHEQAQQRWLALVALDGGYARFVTSTEQI